MSGNQERSNLPTSPQSRRRRAEEMLGTRRTDIASMGRNDAQHLVHELQIHQIELELQNEELRRTQVELAESRELYADLYEFAPVGYVTLNQDGKIVGANLTAATMLGVERNALLTANLSNFVSRGSQDGFFLHRQETLAGNQKQIVEIEMHMADGAPLAMRLESIVRDVRGDRLCLTALIDITERKQAEQALRESEERFAKAFRASPHPIGITEAATGCCIEVNDACLQLLGFRREEMIGTTTLMLGIWPDQEDRARLVERMKAGEPVRNLELSFKTKSGDLRHILVSSDLAELNGTLCLITVGNDITESKQAEERLSRLNQTLEERVTNRTAELKGTNERLKAEITERKRAELLLAGEKKVLELIATGAALPEVLDTLTRVTEAQSTEGMLCSVLLADEEGQRLLYGSAPSLAEAYNAAVHGIAIGPKVGSCGTAAFERKPVFIGDIAGDPRWAAFKDLAATHGLEACHSTPILSGQGRLLGTIAMYYRWPHHPGAHDRQLIERATHLAAIVIERKRADEALQTSDERFRTFFSNASNLAFMKGCDGRYLYVNRRFEEAFQLEKDAALGKSDVELFSREQAELFQRHDRQVLEAGEAMEFEETARYADGLHTSIVVKFPVRDESARIYAIGGIVTDITDRKRIELALQQNQLVLQVQREELQRLTEQLFKAQDDERQRIARDLHDDFGQRLVAATFDLATLERHPPLLTESFGKALEPVRQELTQLADDLRRVAHRLHPSLLKHAGLRAALEEHIQQAMQRTGLRITLKVRDAPDSLQLDLATCLFRVCQESLQNVAKHANATEVLVKLSGSSKGIGLSVTDNGRGFDVHDMSSHRKGLGVTGMRERLRLLNGFFNIHSRPADGTKVCAWISCQEKTS